MEEPMLIEDYDSEYEVFERWGRWWVIETNSRKVIPYHSNLDKYPGLYDPGLVDSIYMYMDDDEFEAWFEITEEERKEIKLICETNTAVTQTPVKYIEHFAQFVAFPPTKQQRVIATKTQETEETNMDCNETHIERTQRDFLKTELRTCYQKHNSDLIDHFKMRDPAPPRTIEEAVERFKTGQFTALPEKERRPYYHWSDQFDWRHPGHKADKEGFDTASEKLNEAYRHAIQDATVDPLDKAKASLRKFEKETFH